MNTNKREKYRAIASLLEEAADTGRPLMFGDKEALDAVPNLNDTLERWKVAPAPKNKIIDLSCLIESEIDCVFYDHVDSTRYLGTLTNIKTLGDYRYQQDHSTQWSACNPRMKHWHYFGGRSHNRPLPLGFVIELHHDDHSKPVGAEYYSDDQIDLDWKHITAFKVLRVETGYELSCELKL